MVLAVGKLKRSASVAKRRIVYGKLEGMDTARSFSDFESRIYTENLNKLLDGPTTSADIWTMSRMRRTLTLPRGARQPYENNWMLALDAQGKNALVEGTPKL